MPKKYSKEWINNLLIGLFLLIALFFPRSKAYFRLYFLTLLLSALILLVDLRHIYWDWLSKIALSILIVSFFTIILRFTFIVPPNTKDFTEFGRLLLPAIMIFFRERFKYINITLLFTIFALYCSLDFLVSVLDFARLDFLGIVNFTQKYYVSENRGGLWYRICGMSSGPGQHGIIMLVFFIFFYNRIFQSKRVILPVIFAILAAIALFLSQSRTSFVAFLLILFGVPLFYLFFGNNRAKLRTLPTAVILIIGGTYIFFKFIDYFHRFAQLSEGIDDINSFNSREEHYSSLFDKANEFPFFYLSGFGKSFFQTTALDNEYLLMLLVHGPLVLLVIVIGVLTFLVQTLLKRDKSNYRYRPILFFVFVGGLIVAYPASFFLQPAIIPITMTLILTSFWEQRKHDKRTSIINR